MTETLSRPPSSAPLHVRLCGAITVEPTFARLPAGRATMLLAVLASSPGETVGRSRLVEILWEADPPSDPRAVLSSLLSRLRRTIGAECLPARGSGVRLELPPGSTIDAEQASDAIDRAREQLAAGQVDAAFLRAGEAATTLARPFAVGFDGIWVTHRRDALADRGLEAQLVVAACGAAPGASPEIVRAGVLAGRTVIERTPHREAAYEATMRCLAALGEVPAALEVFDALRRRLRDDLGATPSPAVRALHLALLAPDVVEAPGIRDGSASFAAVEAPEVVDAPEVIEGAASAVVPAEPEPSPAVDAIPSRGADEVGDGIRRAHDEIARSVAVHGDGLPLSVVAAIHDLPPDYVLAIAEEPDTAGLLTVEETDEGPHVRIRDEVDRRLIRRDAPIAGYADRLIVALADHETGPGTGPPREVFRREYVRASRHGRLDAAAALAARLGALDDRDLGAGLVGVLDRDLAVLLGDAVDVLPAGHPLAPRIMARLALELARERPEEAAALAGRARASLPADAALADRVRVAVAELYAGPDPARASARAVRLAPLIAEAERASDLGLLQAMLIARQSLLLQSGHVSALEHDLVRLEAAAERSDDGRAWLAEASARAGQARMAGGAEDARWILRSVAEHDSTPADADRMAVTTWHRIERLLGEGRASDAVPLADGIAAEVPGWGLPLAVAAFVRVLAGDVDGGRRITAGWTPEDLARVRDRGPGGLSEAALHGVVAARTGERERAALLAEHLLPYVDEHVVLSPGMQVVYLGPVARVLGEIAEAQGDPAGAREHRWRARAAAIQVGATTVVAQLDRELLSVEIEPDGRW